MKKRDNQKHYVKTRFDRLLYTVLKLKILVIPNELVRAHKFKILLIPNVLAHGKLYKHGFMKKCDDIKLCIKSIFDRLFVHHLKNLKYCLFQMYFPMGNHTSMVS
ncbi:hypothetical protein B296_00057073 [Ensete ventricosum]|uniref:Uncharacterized protein n=1 Tax=Ensete ventricosum TaxID=4639 RepID=A0A426XAR9_ENSVE|nr:hypothetical protein B296_00057073 [Ensete ventricosum]